MRRVDFSGGGKSFFVQIGPGLIARVGEFVRQIFPGARCAIISDENVAPLFADPLRESLRSAGFSPELIVLPSGEQTKTLACAGEIAEKLTAAGLDRSSFLVSLGGGVIGDLTGFVASIFLRGIPFVSIPTTLLAQIDSCIGGKTGVNTAAGKNLLGTFHHPALVLADTDALQTLPPPTWNEGFAEAIKHGIICDAELFTSIPAVDRKNPEAFIERNLSLKAAIVAEDEREETGTRSLLNFGHTVGHAIENAAGYGNIRHGEAVALGIIAAAEISVRHAGLSLGEFERIRATVQACHLPVSLPENFPREKIFPALLRDKKFANGRIRFVVAHAIGRASGAENVTLDDLREAIETLSSRA